MDIVIQNVGAVTIMALVAAGWLMFLWGITKGRASKSVIGLYLLSLSFTLFGVGHIIDGGSIEWSATFISLAVICFGGASFIFGRATK